MREKNEGEKSFTEEQTENKLESDGALGRSEPLLGLFSVRHFRVQVQSCPRLRHSL